MSKEVKKFIESLKKEVINNSAISDKERAEICRYLGRSLCKKQTAEDCQMYLDGTQWPGGGDAEKLIQWWAIRQKGKNNGHPSQLKGGHRSKEVSDDEMATVIKQLAKVRGISTAELVKELSKDIQSGIKKKHETLLSGAREAQNAISDFRSANADIINEYERLIAVYNKAQKKADVWAQNHGIK